MNEGDLMPQPLDVSVVVPNWNGRAILGECLGALYAMERAPREVIVVDNGSTDDSAAFVAEHFPQARLLRFTENRGFSRAVNEGIRAAACGVVALLNNDAVAHPQWLARLADALERHPDVGSVASKMLFHDARDRIDSAGDAYTAWGMAYARGHGERDDGRFDAEEEIFGACAGAAAYRREALDDVGLFDENFFAYYEDVDWSFRAQLRGHRCLFVPDAMVYHRYSATSSGQESKLGREEVYLHLTGVLVKNMPFPLLLRNLPAAACAHGMLFAFYLLARARGRRRLPKVPFFRFMGAMLWQRVAVQRGRRAAPRDLAARFARRGFFELVHSEAAR